MSAISRSVNSPFPRLHSVSHIVIPARLESSRLPRKLLLHETGKTVIQHTFEAATTASQPSGITVAVDSEELATAVSNFGGSALMTSPDLKSGTDRVAAVAKTMEHVDIFVNVQGDEPEITGEAIDQVTSLLDQHADADVATLSVPIREESRLQDPNCVKVVLDRSERALYFSRSPIPHVRDWDPEFLLQNPPLFRQHIGIYAYRRDFLLRLAELPPSTLEQSEKLEQLRFLQAGHQIVVGTTEHGPKGIDTLADYEAFIQRFTAA